MNNRQAIDIQDPTPANIANGLQALADYILINHHPWPIKSVKIDSALYNWDRNMGLALTIHYYE